jgi:Fe-S cluster assembly protein SufD
MPEALTLAPWLDALRADAASRFLDAEMPSDSDEVWRYSRIHSIDLHQFGPTEPQSTAVDPELIEGAAATVIIRDGRVSAITRTESLGKATVQTISEHAEGEKLLNSVRGDAGDAVAHLHDANLTDVIVIDVPRGFHVGAPIVIDTYADAQSGLTVPHTIVRAANGASVSVLERRRSGEAEQLVIPTVELDAAPDARIGYLVIQQLGAATISLENHLSSADQQAHVVSSVAAFGGSYARTRADFRLIGRGASGDLLSAYFGDGSQMLDFRTFQDHLAPDTTSNLLFKGAVTGEAQSVYTGLIRVAETAPGTNAFQTNRNLKLSDAAWAYSVPNLEIETNQVSCSHASTVGEIDEDQRFYLESRGVPTTTAEQLLVSGFFAEVIAQFPIDAVKVELQTIIDDALAADRAALEPA